MSATKHSHDRPTTDADLSTDYRAPVVATLLGVDRDGAVRVSVPGHGEARARVLSTVTRAVLHQASSGRQVLVHCEGADPSLPIITGLLEDPVEALLSLSAHEEHLVEAAGRDRVFRAEGSITLVRRGQPHAARRRTGRHPRGQRRLGGQRAAAHPGVRGADQLTCSSSATARRSRRSCWRSPTRTASRRCM
nr:hypothetical protein [Deltaproteobacteria bacterium]